MIEAIAEVFRIDVRGGHGGQVWASPLERGLLSFQLQLLPPIVHRKKIKSFFLRSETAKGVLEYMSDMGIPGYGNRHNAEVSHGESFLQVLEGRFTDQGLYLLDEPKLRFHSDLVCLSSLFLMSWQEEAAKLSRYTFATLDISPRAQIFELSEEGISLRDWKDLELTKNWMRFLEHPESYLKHLTGEQPE